MAGTPMITRPLAVFLMLVGLALVAAGYQRWRRPSLQEVVQALADADLEGDERWAALLRVGADTASATEPAERLLAAMAAAARGDAAAYAAACGGAELPIDAGAAVIGDPAARSRAALGDPLLAALLEAMIAEVGQDQVSARRGYAQVVESSRLFHNDFVRQLAERGGVRMR